MAAMAHEPGVCQVCDRFTMEAVLASDEDTQLGLGVQRGGGAHLVRTVRAPASEQDAGNTHSRLRRTGMGLDLPWCPTDAC